MTTEEVDAARLAMRRLRLPILALPTRRFRPDRNGARADMRATCAPRCAPAATSFR